MDISERHKKISNSPNLNFNGQSIFNTSKDKDELISPNLLIEYFYKRLKCNDSNPTLSTRSNAKKTRYIKCKKKRERKREKRTELQDSSHINVTSLSTNLWKLSAIYCAKSPS